MKRHLILLLLALAGIAAAQGVPHNMVSRHTMVNTNLIGAAIGDGLSLTNGVLSSTGGTDVGAVSNIVEGVVADATNGMVKVENGQVLLDDAEISAASATLGILAVGDLLAGGAAAYYGGDGDEYELAVKGDIPDLNNYAGDIHTGGSIDAGEISVQGASVALQDDLAALDVRTNLPPVAASATVGDLVDAINAISPALRPEEP